MHFNDQGIHAEDIVNDPNNLRSSSVGEDTSDFKGTVLSPPGYTDPSNPAAVGGNMQLSPEVHPGVNDDDYGVGYDGAPPAASTLNLDGDIAGGDKAREDWTNADYKKALEDAGLATSGNRAELEARLEEYENSDDTDDQ